MRILYATDGSYEAASAAAFLARFPHQDDAYVHILTILGPQDPADGMETFVAARSALAGFPGRITTEVMRASGNDMVADIILRTAIRDEVDLIALGATGHTGFARIFLGSVAETVAHRTSRAVLIARPSTGPLKNIVFGLDGSWNAHEAACYASSLLPLPAECVFRLVHVEAPAHEGIHGIPILGRSDPSCGEATENGHAGAERYLNTMAQELRAAGHPIVKQVRIGSPTEELIYAAEELQADLMVIGAHGRSGIERALLGSVSDYVIRHCHSSVLVVRCAAPSRLAYGSIDHPEYRRSDSPLEVFTG